LPDKCDIHNFFSIVYKLRFLIVRCFFVIFVTGEDKVIWS